MTGPDKLEGSPPNLPKIPSSKADLSESQPTKKTSAQAHTTDKVNLSPENIEYAQLLKRIDEVPDIRHERIEEIRKALEDGTYDIDPLLVAKGILQEIVSDSTATKNSPDPPNNTIPS